MKDKVAIYCRISTQMQSTDRQEEDLLKYAEQNNYKVEDVYVDVVTGFSVFEERKRYSDLLKAIDEGKIEIILFSELTRLGRNSTELLSEIQRLQDKGVALYFQKQDLWVRNSKQDLGSKILLAVLAITTTYEIELFAERSLSGKISKITNGGGVGGDNNAYGYCNDENKRISIRNDEANVVKRIFNLYADGKSVVDICEILNAENIPTSYTTRLKEAKVRRKQKGVQSKIYKFDEDNLKWRQSTISRMLSNELYIGHRKVTFHKPNVDKKNKNREVYFEYDVRLENLRIVSDELFFKVQDRLLSSKYNKNNSIKHENLLKSKLKCGECGSNFSVGKSTETTTNYLSGGRTYKCYGRVNRKDKPQTCIDGAEIRQWKLDGLVLSLSLYMFAEINLNDIHSNKVTTLRKEIDEDTKVLNNLKKQLNDISESYKRALKKLLPLDDVIAQELINEEKKNYEEQKVIIEKSIEKYKHRIVENQIIIDKSQKIYDSFATVYSKMEDIRRSKELVKSMIDEFIDEILIYKIHKLWNLVIIKYNNGAEMWGTVKSARYKKSEMFYDELTCKYGIEFQAWLLNNSEHCFNYNKETHKVYYNGNSDIYTNLKIGEYTYDEFNSVLIESEWIGSFPYYSFENQDVNVLPINDKFKLSIMKQ